MQQFTSVIPVSLQQDGRQTQEDSLEVSGLAHTTLIGTCTISLPPLSLPLHPSLVSCPLLIKILMNWRATQKVCEERGEIQPSPKWHICPKLSLLLGRRGVLCECSLQTTVCFFLELPWAWPHKSARHQLELHSWRCWTKLMWGWGSAYRKMPFLSAFQWAIYHTLTVPWDTKWQEA